MIQSQEWGDCMDNKRTFFRAPLYHTTVLILPHNLELEVRDISGNGLLLESYDPLRLDGALTFQFTITFENKEYEFTFPGQLARNFQERQNGRLLYFYGCSFQGATEKQKAALSKLLFKMESRRRK